MRSDLHISSGDLERMLKCSLEGVPVKYIAKRFGRTASYVGKLIQELRKARGLPPSSVLDTGAPVTGGRAVRIGPYRGLGD